MNEFVPLWEIHQAAEWPRAIGPSEGELMILDTVIGGCVTYYLQSAQGLDAQRLEILETCLADLDALLPELEGEASGYFHRLRQVGALLCEAQRHHHPSS
jgi:hypothetical protein